MIENINNFRTIIEKDLAAIRNGATIHTLRGPMTERGVQFALDFVNGLDHETMTEDELSHAVRCLVYRGTVRPVFVA